MFQLFLFLSFFYLNSANNAPIIGILTEPGSDYGADAYIAASYVKFLETGGARVLPIWLNQSADYYERVVNYTNGILFPGGDAPFDTPGGYGEAAYTIYHLAMKSNNRGNFYPLWGTCLGFEVFPYAEVEKDLRVNCSVPDGPYPLQFLEDYKASRLFGFLPEDLFNILSTQNVTYNAHHFCLTQSTLQSYGLDKYWRILTTNIDTNDLQFISSMENMKYPFYGIQYHPEKNAFEFKENVGFPHSSASVSVTQYFANFFVSEARKNQNKFPSREMAAKSLIYNYCPKFTGLTDEYFQQIYGFDHDDYANILL